MKTDQEKIEDRDDAINTARYLLKQNYFVLDTETTGLTDAQMCQIAILHWDGKQYKSLIKPTIPIEEGASAVHHITDNDVKNAPKATEVMRHLPLFSTMVIYNAPFDLKILKQSLLAHGQQYNDERNTHIYDAMLIYAAFRGDWDDYHGNYRWQKLGEACKQCGIEEDSQDGFHDAMYDAVMTDKLMKYVASQKLSTEGV